MELRQLTREDIPAIVEMRIMMRDEREGEGDAQVLREATQAYLNQHWDDPTFVTIFAQEEGKIAAMGSMTLTHVMPTYEHLQGKFAYLLNIYTSPDFRKRGLARLVVEALLEEAKARGCGYAKLNASEAGKPLYVKLGFQDLENEMMVTL